MGLGRILRACDVVCTYIDECENMKGVTFFDFQELLVIWRIFYFLSPFNYPHIHTFNSETHSVDEDDANDEDDDDTNMVIMLPINSLTAFICKYNV